MNDRIIWIQMKLGLQFLTAMHTSVDVQVKMKKINSDVVINENHVLSE